MFLNLLKRVVKMTLHSAMNEWLLETGVSKEIVDELRAQRESIAVESVAQADALAVRRLDVDDEHDAPGEMPALPMPAAAQVTQATEGDGQLLEWIHQQRQANVSWAEIAQGASQKGCQSSEDALRTRYRRWRKKAGLVEDSEPVG